MHQLILSLWTEEAVVREVAEAGTGLAKSLLITAMHKND